MAGKKWLRTEQAAVYANVGVAFIRKLIRNRQLRAIRRRYYVIDRVDLEALPPRAEIQSCPAVQTCVIIGRF